MFTRRERDVLFVVAAISIAADGEPVTLPDGRRAAIMTDPDNLFLVLIETPAN